MFEVEAGKLAATKASAQDVRDFAVSEIHDHMLVGDKLKSISESEGITFAHTLNDQFSGKLKYLSTLSGVAFDSAYMDEMASLHDADGAAFAKEAKDSGSMNSARKHISSSSGISGPYTEPSRPDRAARTI